MKKIDYKWTALALQWVACFLRQGMRQIFPPLASTIGGSFVFGAVAPVVLGWVKDSFSMSVGLASISAFFIAGTLVILVARVKFLNRDRVG